MYHSFPLTGSSSSCFCEISGGWVLFCSPQLLDQKKGFPRKRTTSLSRGQHIPQLPASDSLEQPPSPQLAILGSFAVSVRQAICQFTFK